MAISLYYIHDPMCSWCWGFRVVWMQIQQQIQQRLTADLRVRFVVGGLAPDSDQLMPRRMQLYLQQTWEKIQQTIPGTEFNFDFWSNCQPRRSTYPACRAVLAARQQGLHFEPPMIEGIQRAYYLQARNPSDLDVLVEVAGTIGLDKNHFSRLMSSDTLEQTLQKELIQCQQLLSHANTAGFPSVVLQIDSQYLAVPRDYNDPQPSLDFIQQYLQDGR